MLETFFRTHAYLVENFNAPVRRTLIDNIDWSHRMIAIRGPRGVGRTSILLQFAKEFFDPRTRKCLYINTNNFYFQARGIVDFAGEFVAAGGIVLLIDQAFKLHNWREQLCECYHKYPLLRIVYTTTPVEETDADESEIARLSRRYVLHGFSFREFINLQTGNDFHTFTYSDIIRDHEYIQKSILPRVQPMKYFDDYLHYGYYPFYLENNNFTEGLLKAMNSMMEVDILFNKQVELKYLSRIKKLLYLLAMSEDSIPNVSELAEAINTSRATVMNYLKYLEEARLVNMVYREGETFPKKPAAVMLHDPNLMYAINAPGLNRQNIMETYLVNTLWRHHTVNRLRREGTFRIDGRTDLCVCEKSRRLKLSPETMRVVYDVEKGEQGVIPIWMFGFLY